jgi:hypothetical protein
MAGWTADAAWPGKSDKDKEEQRGESSPAQINRAEQGRAAKDKAMRESQAAMADSRWEIEVKLSSSGQAVVQPDVITFERGMMNSETLEKSGFSRGEYSLYPPQAQSIAWEAMQRKEADGVSESAIWRGEVTGETMQGTIIKKRSKGDQETAENFTFSGKRVAAAPKPVEPATAAPAPAAVEPAGSAPVAPPQEPAAVEPAP